MAANSSRPSLKRPFSFDDDDDDDDEEEDKSHKPPVKKKVRFPKGKKARPGEEGVEIPRAQAEPSPLSDPRLAAKERAKRRGQSTTEQLKEDSKGLVDDVASVEVAYEDCETFVEDGIQIEPFNLNKEREEGYFDANMNFIEYVKEKEAKDAWLDSLEVDPKYVVKAPEVSRNDDEVEELTPRDIGTIKRRIADALEPGETVLQALRRLKGNSNSRKDKMSSETKSLFDQLTEDAVTLMENGEYDVYHEKQEIFQREAEGYESLARSRGEGPSISAGQESSGTDILSGLADVGAASSGSAVPSSDLYDMFGDDDELPTANPSTEDRNLVSVPSNNGVNLSNPQSNNSESGTSESDYVYDESSGYYYSSSLGYYYDPSTGLYCSAVSGQWFSFNEETGTYDEIQASTSTAE